MQARKSNLSEFGLYFDVAEFLQFADKRLASLLRARMSRPLPACIRRPPSKSRILLSKLGKKGGKVGGAARARAMTPEQRRESARKAVMARWSKGKGDSTK